MRASFGMVLIAGLGLGPAPAAAQTPAEWLAEGRALARSDPGRALAAFEHVLAVDSTSYEANWRAAAALVDQGEATPPETRSARDSLYGRAERYARRAVAADSSRVEGLFALAMALGRAALTRGGRDRIRAGDEIYRTANRILAIDPDHDGAHHVLGLWNAEVMRLSGLSRFFARKILGGKTLGQASWAEAIAHLERAVALDSTRISHRLDLARVYAESKRYRDARSEIEAIGRLPDADAADPRYRRDANELLKRIEGKEDRDDAGPAGAGPD